MDGSMPLELGSGSQMEYIIGIYFRSGIRTEVQFIKFPILSELWNTTPFLISFLECVFHSWIHRQMLKWFCPGVCMNQDYLFLATSQFQTPSWTRFGDL